MPGRITPLVNGEYYHLFNRGTEKREVFLEIRDFKRFLKTLYYYQFLGPKIRYSEFIRSKSNTFNPKDEDKLVEIICYCLMPNHFHLLIKQLKDNGISIFISQLTNSYTKYFNTKNKRVGALFQGVFKSVFIDSDEQLLHLSRYIHLNPIVSDLVKSLDHYPWSSYFEYIYSKDGYCKTSEILNSFSSNDQYRQFLEDHVEYGRSLHLYEHQLIDIND